MTAALQGREWPAARHGRTLPTKKRLGTHCTGGWVGPRAGLEGIRSPDSPARSQSLYRLSYPDHHSYTIPYNKNKKYTRFFSRATATHLVKIPPLEFHRSHCHDHKNRRWEPETRQKSDLYSRNYSCNIHFNIFVLLFLSLGRDSSFGIGNCYRLEDSGIDTRWELYFPHPSRPNFGPTQLHVKWVPSSFQGVKRPNVGIAHPSPSSELRSNKEWVYTSSHALGLLGLF